MTNLADLARDLDDITDRLARARDLAVSLLWAIEGADAEKALAALAGVIDESVEHERLALIELSRRVREGDDGEGAR